MLEKRADAVGRHLKVAEQTVQHPHVKEVEPRMLHQSRAAASRKRLNTADDERIFEDPVR